VPQSRTLEELYNQLTVQYFIQMDEFLLLPYFLNFLLLGIDTPHSSVVHTLRAGYDDISWWQE
jgi:hypothetical protein